MNAEPAYRSHSTLRLSCQFELLSKTFILHQFFQNCNTTVVQRYDRWDIGRGDVRRDRCVPRRGLAHPGREDPAGGPRYPG